MPKTAVATPYRGSIAPSSGICLWSYFSLLLTFFWFCSSQWLHRCLRPDSCPGLVIGPFEITTRWCTLLGIWLMIRVWQPSAYWSGSPWAIHESSLRSLSSSLGVFYFLAEKLGPRCFRNLSRHFPRDRLINPLRFIFTMMRGWSFFIVKMDDTNIFHRRKRCLATIEFC